jgi:hypothetical protein
MCRRRRRSSGPPRSGPFREFLLAAPAHAADAPTAAGCSARFGAEPSGGGGRARARSARRSRRGGAADGPACARPARRRNVRRGDCAYARLRCRVGGRSGWAVRSAALSGCSWIWRRKQLASYGLCTAGREEPLQAARKGRRLNGRRGEGRRLWQMGMRRTSSGEAKPVYSGVYSSCEKKSGWRDGAAPRRTRRALSVDP